VGASGLVRRRAVGGPVLLSGLRRSGRARLLLLALAVTAGIAASSAQAAALQGIHKIRHVVIIMQENRSFDSYFGTFPGADGIPGLAGNPGRVPCIPNPDQPGHCHKPWHDNSDITMGQNRKKRNTLIRLRFAREDWSVLFIWICLNVDSKLPRGWHS